jgi:hypothetical protein
MVALVGVGGVAGWYWVTGFLFVVSGMWDEILGSDGFDGRGI